MRTGDTVYLTYGATDSMLQRRDEAVGQTHSTLDPSSRKEMREDVETSHSGNALAAATTLTSYRYQNETKTAFSNS